MKNYLHNEGESAKDFAVRLQKQVDDYKSEVHKLKTKEELDAEEKKCIDEIDKYDEYLKNTEYDLLKEVTYDGTTYSRKDIAIAIVYFLNKTEVKWDFTLGLYELSKLWRNDVEKLSFHEMDSTLRCLDQCTFKGYKEWKDILAINEFFKANHEQFTIDTAGTIYLAQRHNTVLEQLELIKTIDTHNANVKEKESETTEPVAEVKKSKRKKSE